MKEQEFVKLGTGSEFVEEFDWPRGYLVLIKRNGKWRITSLTLKHESAMDAVRRALSRGQEAVISNYEVEHKMHWRPLEKDGES